MPEVINGTTYFTKEEWDKRFEDYESYIARCEERISILLKEIERLEKLVPANTPEGQWGIYFDKGSEDFNLSKQAELMRTDVELYKRLVEKYKYSRKR